MKMNIQFFADELGETKNEGTVSTEGMQALQRIMDNFGSIEDYSDDFDTVRKAMESVDNGTSAPVNTDSTNWEEAYNKLKKEYVKRFGEYTQQTVSVQLVSETENKPDLSKIDFGRNLFNGSTE